MRPRPRFAHGARWWILGALFLVVPLASSAPTSLSVLNDTSQIPNSTFITDTLNAPTGLTATGGSSIVLNWTATTDTYASGHRVFRSTTTGGPYTQIAQLTPRTTVTYTDTPTAGTYYYVVRAYYQNWESVNSGEASATVSATCAALTPVWLAGMEHGAVSGNGGGLFDAVTGSPSTDAVVKRNGGYSLKVAPVATSQKATKNLPAGQSVVVARFAVRLVSLPISDSELFLVQEIGSAAIFDYEGASGKFRSRLGISTSATGPVVVAGTWYLIEVKANFGTSPKTMDWRVDGVDQTQVTVSEAANTASAVEFGTPNARTYVANFDDIVVSQTASAYPIGDGKVLGLRPDGMGTHNIPGNFQNDSGTAIDASTYTRVDDDPMTSTTDYIKQVTASGTSYIALTFQDTTQTCIRGVSGLLGYHSAGTSVNLGKTSIFDGSTERVIFSGDMSESSIFYKSAIVSPTAPPWSQAAINGLTARVGFSTDVSPVPFWDSLLIEYETPGP